MNTKQKIIVSALVIYVIAYIIVAFMLVSTNERLEMYNKCTTYYECVFDNKSKLQCAIDQPNKLEFIRKCDYAWERHD